MHELCQLKWFSIPNPCEKADSRTLKQRQEHALCQHLQWNSIKLFGMVSSRKWDAAPLFFTVEYLTLQNRQDQHVKLQGRGLQNWGRERKQHAGQSRMHSCCCKCRHGKEENGGLFHRGYHTSKLKVALIQFVTFHLVPDRSAILSPSSNLQDTRRNCVAWFMDTSICLVPLCCNVWTFCTWAIPAQLLPAPDPKRREDGVR